MRFLKHENYLPWNPFIFSKPQSDLQMTSNAIVLLIFVYDCGTPATNALRSSGDEIGNRSGIFICSRHAFVSADSTMLGNASRVYMP